MGTEKIKQTHTPIKTTRIRRMTSATGSRWQHLALSWWVTGSTQTSKTKQYIQLIDPAFYDNMFNSVWLSHGIMGMWKRDLVVGMVQAVGKNGGRKGIGMDRINENERSKVVLHVHRHSSLRCVILTKSPYSLFPYHNFCPHPFPPTCPVEFLLA